MPRNSFTFREYLLNENKVYLGQKIGDILNALHELEENMQAMGTRHMVSASTQIVNQIRRILHSHWSEEEVPHLKSLQKAGAAIMRAIEDKDDLKGVITSVSQELQGTMGKLGVPQNDLMSAQVTPTPEPKKIAPPQGGQQPPQQPAPAPQAGGPAPQPGQPPAAPPQQPQQPPAA